MSSPSSCVRCSRPLAAESASGLCPTCLSAGDTSRPPPDAFSPLATATFLPDIAGSTVTREPSEAEIAGNGVTASLAAPPSTERGMPAAPVGYELVRKLGHGGMGDVYLARDVPADRLVAVKFLRAAHNPVAVERFLTEVRALARVTHPGIVRVLAHDFYRSVPFFAMPYVPGGTLAQRVSGATPLESREAASLIAAAARAAHAAHEAGVVHRDIKPSNILLDESGAPLVSDFGLAKRTDEDGGLTTGSGPLGTLSYMPPEQTRRGDVDRRADVYGLGATLYHLLTGRPPFSGPEPELLAQIVSSTPRRPRAIRPEIPLGLEAVVVKCLEKDPAARYPTAAALAADLERFLAGGDPDAPPMTRWRRARLWARQRRSRLVAAVAAPLAVAGLVAFLVLAFTPAAATDPRLTPDDVRRKLRNGERVTLVSADGTVTVRTAWALQPGELVPSRIDGTPCSFTTSGTLVLVLIDDPGIPQFLIRADLRQDLSLVSDGGGESADFGQAGIAIGLRETVTEPPASVHSLWVVQFQEYHETDAGARPDRRIQVTDRSLDTRPARSLSGPKQGGSHISLAFPDAPRPWRSVEVEVSPDRVLVRHGGREVSDPVERVNARRAKVEDRVRAAGWPGAAAVALPRWPVVPCGVGIAASSCWVSARSVTIEPVS